MILRKWTRRVVEAAFLAGLLVWPAGLHAQGANQQPGPSRPKIPLETTGAAHEPSQLFGVSTHMARPTRGWSPDLLPMIRALGVSSFRDDDDWNVVESRKNEFRFDPLIEEAVNRSGALNMQALLLLGFGNPLYENRVDPEAFTRYALATIEHYKGRVKYFELYSEPDLHEFPTIYGGTWNGKEADNSDSAWVKEFAEFATYVGREIKKKHPEILLVGYSSNPPSNQRHFKYPEMWKYVDVLAIHPYPYRLPPEMVPWGGKEIEQRDGVKVADDDQSFASHIRLYREGVKKVGRPDMPIWITEVGYTTARLKTAGLWQGFTEPAQAIYLARLAILAAGNGVQKTYFYDFLDDGDNPNEVEDNLGLVRRDYSPKPSYYAIQRLCALLPGDSHLPVSGLSAAAVKIERPAPAPRQDSTVWDGQVIRYLEEPQAHIFQRPDGRHVLFFWQPGRIYADAQEEPANVTVDLAGSGLKDLSVGEVGRVVSGARLNPAVSREGTRLILKDLPYGSDPVYIVLQ